MPERARDSPVHRLPDWRLTLPLAQSCHRCGARTRSGASCKSPAMQNGRCRMHLRPHIRVEMSLKPRALPPVARPIASLIGAAQQKPPEVAGFLCVDPVEPAADKLSALAWRVHARQRGSEGDDPAIIRHVHDLAALRETAAPPKIFRASCRRQCPTVRAGEGRRPHHPIPKASSPACSNALAPIRSGQPNIGTMSGRFPSPTPVS
jgi:hypothetical protein